MKIKTTNPLKAGNYFLVFFIFCFFSCKEYLDVKPSKSLVVASELKDLQALLDNSPVFNHYQKGLGEASSDNYYLTDQGWAALNEANRNLYIWGKELFFSDVINPWLNEYRVIYYSNYILETLVNIEKTKTNNDEWNQIKGSSLFFRAFNFYNLVVTFSKAYDAETAKEDLGIPLRLTSDFNIPSERANVEDSYQQVINDLNEAVALLPERSVHPFRPSKIAAYALLSRVYMAMRNYELASRYAESCLKIDASLMDYNELNSIAAYPIATLNVEVLFYAVGGVDAIGNWTAKIDSNLYGSYNEADLRKQVFYELNPDERSYKFKGSYSGSTSIFMGLAINEIYMNRAECLVRSGQYQQGMKVLNKLLVKRYNSEMEFANLVADSADDALKLILDERRKELVMRDIRWMDIKRLNKEPGNEIVIKRNLNGEILTLLPNDNRYALPFPADVIELTNMEQNPR